MVEIFCEGVDFNPELAQSFGDWAFAQVASDYEYKAKSLNIVLLSDEGLLEMNNEFLSHDYFTDIITFDLSELENELEAELYISLDRVKENAVNESVELINELQRVIIHGLLHLVGYEDSTEELKKEMQHYENQYLNLYVSRETKSIN